MINTMKKAETEATSFNFWIPKEVVQKLNEENWNNVYIIYSLECTQYYVNGVHIYTISNDFRRDHGGEG